MHSVWAVSRNTIAQALRMKVALVVIVLLFVLLPLMSVLMDGDGTLEGKLQTFTSYGLSLMSVLLCVLTIVISVYTLSNDLKRKYIYLVVTKPIGRYQLLFGKLLGVIILDVILLVVFSSILYGLTIMMPKLAGADPESIARADKKFFTARAALTDPVDKERIKRLANQTYEKLRASQQLPKTMTKKKILAELRGRERLRSRTVGVGREKVWKFKNVRSDETNETLFVQYKYEVGTYPSDGKVYGLWRVGDFRQLELYGAGNLQTPIYGIDRADPVRVTSEFEVPVDAIASDGSLQLAFFNSHKNQTTIIPEEVQILLRVDSFTVNYIRAVLLILARLIFLAALGVSSATWLSFPVAILICIVVFLIGTVNGFVVESFTTLGREAILFYKFVIKPVLWLLPQFDADYNPAPYMASARVLSWMFLAKVYAVTVFIKSFLLLLFGMWIFSNREIAKISA